ncbi:hypothetical protein IHE49_07105 [Rhodanobacter sp. 7MK24]|uniref:hypothetical protein n=1 Tax=Rhodanobacter sp. 7MK24 TaxID=2775922 RepID=UPI001782648B|nr:hypothetical protein [Rhodanobacter sp. 7MK24]MBD8880245.1 hypothetical protein [Rhodanobacter sp. 7MK24]
MKQDLLPSEDRGALTPGAYPRSYRTPVSFRLWRLGLAVAFLYILHVITQVVPPVHQTSDHLAYALILLILIGCVTACLRSVVVAKKVELTATSLIVTQTFSRTARMLRKDIAACYLTRTRWMCVVVKHRNPKVASIRLFYLNYDDAFWDWFADIPGERDARGQSWWSRPQW